MSVKSSIPTMWSWRRLTRSTCRQSCRQRRCQRQRPKNALLIFGFLLSRQAGRILVRTLAKACPHCCRQRNGVVSELLAQTIGRRQGLVPFVVRGSTVEGELFAFLIEVSGMDAEQPYGGTVPIGAKKLANGGKHFGID